MPAFGRAPVFGIVLALSVLPFEQACAQSGATAASEAIAAIIYSDLDKAGMLARLERYVAVGGTLDEFRRRTGLDTGLCLAGGPGVEDCRLANGLQLVADPDGVIRIIRRDERTIGARHFQSMSISGNTLEWNGYVRAYPD